MRGGEGGAPSLGGAWRDEFDWKKGARLEVLCEDDWWDVEVIDLDKEKIMIHYVGGDAAEEEWILKSSDRLRPSQPSSDHARPPPSTSDPLKSDSNAESHSADADDGLHRPMRRSRMLSDDARLALQLQEEEMRAARDMKSSSRKRSRPTSSSVTKKPTAPSVQKPTAASSTPASAASSAKVKVAHDEKVKVVAPSARNSGGSRPAGAGQTVVQPKPSKSRKSTSDKSDSPGMVSFIIIPDDSITDVPALNRRHQSLTEETTVFQIKRSIVDEIMPGVEVSKIDIRTPSGLLLGQDHSLKYVRTFLWPPVKGDLVLKYSRSKMFGNM